MLQRLHERLRPQKMAQPPPAAETAAQRVLSGQADVVANILSRLPIADAVSLAPTNRLFHSVVMAPSFCLRRDEVRRSTATLLVKAEIRALGRSALAKAVHEGAQDALAFSPTILFFCFHFALTISAVGLPLSLFLISPTMDLSMRWEAKLSQRPKEKLVRKAQALHRRSVDAQRARDALVVARSKENLVVASAADATATRLHVRSVLRHEIALEAQDRQLVHHFCRQLRRNNFWQARRLAKMVEVNSSTLGVKTMNAMALRALRQQDFLLASFFIDRGARVEPDLLIKHLYRSQYHASPMLLFVPHFLPFNCLPLTMLASLTQRVYAHGSRAAVESDVALFFGPMNDDAHRHARARLAANQKLCRRLLERRACAAVDAGRWSELTALFAAGLPIDCIAPGHSQTLAERIRDFVFLSLQGSGAPPSLEAVHILHRWAPECIGPQTQRDARSPPAGRH